MSAATIVALASASSKMPHKNGTKGKDQRTPLTFETVVVTPSIAAQWMEKNTKNRKIAARHKAQYARDMKAGRWRLTGDAIRFDRDGNLLDGQHRLQACIDADVNFTTFVIYGLDPSDQDVMDTQRPRTASDMLAMHGYTGTVILAAMCRHIFGIKAGISMFEVKMSNQEILRIVEDRPKLMASVGRVWGFPSGIPRAPIAVVHYIAANVLKDTELAHAFVDVFKTGIPAYQGCPAHALRERIIRAGDTRNHLKRQEILRAVIHAWNHFSNKEPLTYFKVPKEVVIRGVKPADI